MNPAFGQIMEPTDTTRELSRDIDKRAISQLEAIRLITKESFDKVKYTPDITVWDTVDMFQSPDVTLERGTGDCEDVSFLIASIIKGLERQKVDSVRVAIGDYREPFRAIVTHAWVEVRIGERWYICEGTTGETMNAPFFKYVPYLALYKDKLKFIKTYWKED